MAKLKSRAQQFADLADPTPQDFDPEEDHPPQDSEDSDSGASEEDLAGTEHYAAVSKSKLRKPEEISLGPQYAGSRISREALLDGNSGDEAAGDSGSEGDDSSTKYANPDDSDLDIDDEDGDIDSDEAFGESDAEKFDKFVFRGSGKPKVPNSKGGRATASDFMSEDSESEKDDDDQDGASETDEDVLDTAEQHADDSENEVFSTARQFAGNGTDETNESDSGDDEVIGEDEILSDDSQSNGDQDGDDQEDAEEEEDEDENEEESDDGEASRAELRKIMNEEQKEVVATISQAAKADADKGNAVKLQRKSFDSLLSVRMVLQKALVATNSMATIDEKDPEGNEPYEAAEQAAVKLWNTLDGLRHELSKSRTDFKAGQKRKLVDVSAPSSKFWEKMQSSEVSMIDVRQTTLEKWSSKVRGTTAVPLTKKLNPTVTQSITSVLQDQLASSEHLIKKTKIPRSCAPIQRDAKLAEDPDIYDDGNFYQMLLKELVDQRRVESLNAPAPGVDTALQWTAVKEAKTKKVVDTRASKGRKLRYTVHEKLQNFMAPEDRTGWEPEAIDRFFGTLLGQKMTLGEDVEMEDDEDDGVSVEEEGLKLFRSAV
ncbi:hypothetical protein HYALB_00007877 [Hymenoscyphus albidus]|uniref:Protein BFR2 n=1 Tax=Hymenoscyphus albidus TaxID=595503 RepID=A0A9N9Q5A3_9HELO|nr:hypothetical protein HYALB_00007877 [Hymenoscyphus albidus]